MEPATTATRILPVLLGQQLCISRALVTRDLRSFDALNYFYELPSSVLIRLRVNPRLFAFWTGCRLADTCPARLSLADLKKLSSMERFKVLSERYRCPLNIGAPGESEVAKELLRHLMVVERVKLEKGTALEVEGTLLELNLVGRWRAGSPTNPPRNSAR